MVVNQLVKKFTAMESEG